MPESKPTYTLIVNGIEFESNDLITFTSADFTVKKSIVRRAGGWEYSTMEYSDEYSASLNLDNSIQAKGKSFKEALVSLFEAIRFDSVEKIKEKYLKIDEFNKEILSIKNEMHTLNDQIVSYKKEQDIILDSIADYNNILEAYNNEDFKSEN